MKRFAILGLFLAGCSSPAAPHPLPRASELESTQRDPDRYRPLIDWSDGLSLDELLCSL